MIDVIMKTILAGVGAALTTTEKAEAALQEMVRQGKLSAADARIIAEKIAEQGRREFEEMSQDLGAKVRAMLDVLPGALPLPGWKDALIAGLSIAVAVLAAKVAGRF